MNALEKLALVFIVEAIGLVLVALLLVDALLVFLFNWYAGLLAFTLALGLLYVLTQIDSLRCVKRWTKEA